jgi:hypothetical protein
MLPIAASWTVPLDGISELIGLQAGLFAVALFFSLESWGLQSSEPLTL